MEIEGAKNVGIWIRVSTDDQAKGDSPKNHLMRAEAYAKAKGWNVVTVYDLSGVSGKNVLEEHSESKRMLSDIESGRINALVFSKLARFARNTKQLLEVAEVFQKHDAGLISLEESIDTSTPSGRFFFTILGAVGQWEREETGSRIKASIPNRIKMGKSVGGAAVFGYMWDKNKRLVPNPEEAPIRKLMYETFAQVKKIGTTAKILNEKGYRTRNGKEFKSETVKRLLKDTTAKGIRIGNKVNAQKQAKDKDQWIEVEIEAIVPQQLWQTCNDILDSFTAKSNAVKHTVHLFSGMTYCECGSKMYVETKNQKYTCTKKGCFTKIAKEDLESIFLDEISDFVFDHEKLSNYLGGIESEIKDKQNQIEICSKQQAQASKRLDALIELYQDGKLNKNTFGEKSIPLENQIAELEKNIAILLGEIDHLKILVMSQGEIIQSTQSVASKWKTYDSNMKRQLIELVTEKIVIGNEKINIILYSVPLEDHTKSVTDPQLILHQLG